MTLEVLTAATGGLFVFLLLLFIFREGGGGISVAVELPSIPKNPIGFAVPAV